MRHLQVVLVTAVILSVIQPYGARVHAQYNPNPNSEMSEDKNITSNKTEVSEESHEIEIDDEEKDKKFLDDAMKMVLDPQSALILKTKTLLQSFQSQLEELDNANITFDMFMAEMDNLSLEVCKTSQDALWSYVMDINNDVSKNVMVRIAAEEDEIKKQYWNILKKNYLQDYLKVNETKYNRKIRIIKERGTNVQMPQSKQREEIDTMQKIWSRVSVCAYNATICDEDSVRSMSDVITIFKTSNDSKELKYYWAAYRDATGKKVRPIFKDYVERMNVVAESENFTDAGQMWQYAFEDDDFVNNVNRIWREIKPLYDLLHDYVRLKLITLYPEELSAKDKLIPAHILGNLWAQEWQSTFPKVVPYPMCMRPVLNETIQSKDLFDAVDDFHQSLGFESAKDSYQDIKETATTANCLPSSHDMCDGVHYKIKWCGEKITDVVVGLSRAARLLGHVQYFKHYKNQPPLYRDGPNPAFHDAISDIVAIQLISPEHLKTLNLAKVKTGAHVTLNHLLWVALEKFPLMAYAYVLDQWRWDVFKNTSMENWNEHWWDLRINETGVSPPVPRNESDLDPAAKYHVVSHVQYITYLISHVLEFQILLSLCNRANHTGALHECSIYGVKEAGKLLSDGMSLGASKDWRTVLQTITGETELSTQGILKYFAPLEDFLRRENVRLSAIDLDMDKSAPMIIGGIAFFLFILIIILYCVMKRDSARKMFSICGLSKNGSLDIVTNDVPMKKRTDVDGVSEDKV